MTLHDYLRAARLSDEQFGHMLGVSPFAVGKWRRGERFPRPSLLRRIEQLTGGKVTASDLLPARAATSELGAATNVVEAA